MKRICVAILLFVLLLASVSCFAESTEPAEILFRGIPWGSTLSEVQEQFPNVSWSKPNEDSAFAVMKDLLDKRARYFDGKVQCRTYTYSLKDFKVAGYEVDSITLWCAFTPDESGFLPKDTNHTKFYKANYRISPKDLDAVTTDLINKLTSIYGEVAEHTTSGPIIEENHYIWYGANNTAVSLQTEKYSSGSTDIHIWYATLDGDQYLQDALNALIAEENANAAGDISVL